MLADDFRFLTSPPFFLTAFLISPIFFLCLSDYPLFSLTLIFLLPSLYLFFSSQALSFSLYLFLPLLSLFLFFTSPSFTLSLSLSLSLLLLPSPPFPSPDPSSWNFLNYATFVDLFYSIAYMSPILFIIAEWPPHHTLGCSVHHL